ncbi:MAG: GlsB/YeaQ/YmgE family stress response membrane protein [Oscillospiraceae bacterium]|nr:GlsB/YeaQ/YmgE family stress response membrane protein [Oscillospiraceae bacterium]
MFLNLIVDLIIGAIVGWVASMLMGGKTNLVRCVVIGLIGGFVGGLIMHLLGFRAATRWAQFLVALGGSCLVLWFDNKYLK